MFCFFENRFIDTRSCVSISKPTRTLRKKTIELVFLYEIATGKKIMMEFEIEINWYSYNSCFVSVKFKMQKIKVVIMQRITATISNNFYDVHFQKRKTKLYIQHS